MANLTMALTMPLGRIGVDNRGDLLSRTSQSMAQQAYELKAEASIGSARYADNPLRRPYGSGHWDQTWEARLDDGLLRIRKLREDDYLPSLLGPRRWGERAPLAVTQAACVRGVSTRNGDKLLRAPGSIEIDKSDVSRNRQELDYVSSSKSPLVGHRRSPAHTIRTHEGNRSCRLGRPSALFGPP